MPPVSEKPGFACGLQGARKHLAIFRRVLDGRVLDGGAEKGYN